MVIAIFGESCVGKSTLAAALKEALGADLFSGKDYLRLAKNEAQAEALFRQMLSENTSSAGALIYVISEKPQLSLLPDGCVRVLVTAELEVIKERFARRTGGKLPLPVAAMLEKKHGSFDAERCDIHITDKIPTEDAVAKILSLIEKI